MQGEKKFKVKRNVFTPVKIIALCFIFFFSSFIQLDAQHKTKNIFLITLDGFRWEELFTGADSSLMNSESGGVQQKNILKKKFWRQTAKKRREALMPFFWNVLMKNGIVYGNRSLHSDVMVTNKYCVSLPGYAEILSGSAQPEIINNKPKQIQSVTVMEFLKDQLHLAKYKIAVFASWNKFPYVVSKVPGVIYCNAGDTNAVDGKLTGRQRLLNRLQDEAPSPWDGIRLDAFTFYQGMEFLNKHHPRVFYFSFDETDDWAHMGRYDRVLEAAHRIDGYLNLLWKWCQSTAQYRNKTSFILTTDHGRGGSNDDGWKDHGSKIEGSEYIWIAIVGPDTPHLGELSNTKTVYQKDIASTLAKLLGYDFKKVSPTCGAFLSHAFEKRIR
uniref:Phosphoglyceromutase n=1 Tax=candidate division WOR-3 bacterium TaxID=2052148 RepID=A0A7V3KPT0_UNCW3